MSKVLRILLVIVLFIIFFEVGLFSSYTIVTAEVPDVKGLIDMQVSYITNLFSPQNVNEVLIKDPTNINISNKKDVALKMEELSNVDGINVGSLNVTTYDDPKNDKINVTIEALGYASPNSTSGQIVISQEPAYKVIFKGVALHKNGELIVNISSLKVDSVLKLYK
ncbi:MAG: hypothetical protein K6A34_03250 [Methanobrevibacter sp.]|nr:hypothetical protein [Methanobrevibacter sp.]